MSPDQAHLHDPALLERWFETLARTIAFDFDGVLHPYTNGWTGSIPDDEPPMPGAREALRRLVEDDGYLIVVFSTRADHDEGRAGITAWLDKHDLLRYVIRVTHETPAAIAYVDDRAISFAGDWVSVHEGIERLAGSRAHGAAHQTD